MASRAGAEAVLVTSPQTKIPTDWSADGRFLLYESVDPQTNNDLWNLPVALREPQGHIEQSRGIDGGPAPRVFLKTPFDERSGAFSPDGRSVACQSNESGRVEIYVRTFAGSAASGAAVSAAGGQWQVSPAGGVHPRWRPDGRELYYLAPSGSMMAAPITITGASVAPGAPVTLFPTRILGGGTENAQGRQHDVVRDGRFLVNTVLDEASAPVTLIQNWHPAAKK